MKISQRISSKMSGLLTLLQTTMAMAAGTPTPEPQSLPLNITQLIIPTLIFITLFLAIKVKTMKAAVTGKLNELEQLKDEFLANTSHELRAPLHGIIGITESLLDKNSRDIPTRALTQIKMVLSSGIRLSHLIDDILDFSKLKHSQLNLETTAVDLNSLTNLVFAHCDSLIGDKPVKLVNGLEPGLPPVEADENRLAQILYNLVGNAIKSTNTGSVEVWALPEGNQIQVYVTDTGIGMNHKKLENIFHAYDQASADSGCTGLGLSVTRKLVELHGGTISVASAPNEGSTFSFTLNTSSKDLSPKVSPSYEPSSKTNQPMNHDGKFQILIVDDDPINRQVLLNMLEPTGYGLTEARDGVEALQTIEMHGPFDMVLLDVMMPKMNGFDVCRSLRKTYAPHELPILFLTAKTQPEDLTTGFNVGGNDFLTKPLCRAELLARLETHLQLLDINRNLEERVKDRTSELERHYSRLEKISEERDSRNQELESMFKIMHGVNQPGKEDLILERLLEEGMKLFPQADKAVFLTRSNTQFKIKAHLGYPPDTLQDYHISQEALTNLYRGKSLAIKQGVYLIRGSSKLVRYPCYRPLLPLNSALAMAVNRKGLLSCVLLFIQSSQDQAFDHDDVGRLERFLLYAATVLERKWLISDLAEHDHQLKRGLEQAGLIQNSMIPSEDILERCVSDHFLIFTPKGDASRDFYWFFEDGGALFLAVADAGDYGISSALTCTLSLHLIASVVGESQMRRPAKILEYVYANLRKASPLSLSISICRWEPERRRLSYATAGRPIYRATQLDGEPQMEPLETCPNLLGMGDDPVKYEQKVEILKEDDAIFLTTDGFENQQNEKQEPYGSERFKLLLLSNARQSMAHQKRALQDELANYRIMEDRSDDITILGFRP